MARRRRPHACTSSLRAHDASLDINDCHAPSRDVDTRVKTDRRDQQVESKEAEREMKHPGTHLLFCGALVQLGDGRDEEVGQCLEGVLGAVPRDHGHSH